MTDEPKPYVLKAESGKFKVTGSSVQMKIKRGDASYAYFYIVLAFFVGFCWTVIQVWDDARKVAAIVFITALSIYLFLFSARFQNRLLGLKSWYEDQSR